MKLLMRDEAKGREHTIFVTIFSALMVMLAIVVMLIPSIGTIAALYKFMISTLRLDENAVDILDKQVENRARYIEAQLQQAQELTDLSTYINETAQQMLDDETLSLKTLDSSSSDSLPLLQAAAPRMLETLRSKRISGIFLILNTHDFTDRTSGDRLHHRADRFVRQRHAHRLYALHLVRQPERLLYHCRAGEHLRPALQSGREQRGLLQGPRKQRRRGHPDRLRASPSPPISCRR